MYGSLGLTYLEGFDEPALSHDEETDEDGHDDKTTDDDADDGVLRHDWKRDGPRYMGKGWLFEKGLLDGERLSGSSGIYTEPCCL